MARRRKRAEGGPNLLGYLGGEPQREEGRVATARTGSGLEDEVRRRIVELGKVSKGDLFAWARDRGIPLNAVMRAVDSMCREGRLVRRLEDGELVYVVKK